MSAAFLALCGTRYQRTRACFLLGCGPVLALLLRSFQCLVNSAHLSSSFPETGFIELDMSCNDSEPGGAEYPSEDTTKGRLSRTNSVPIASIMRAGMGLICST